MDYMCCVFRSDWPFSGTRFEQARWVCYHDRFVAGTGRRKDGGVEWWIEKVRRNRA
jgi:hypothetical protein